MYSIIYGLFATICCDLAFANSWPPDSTDVKDWFALGDSFSAGPGAGTEWDNDGDGKGNSETCYRRSSAYAPQLDRDQDMLGGDNHKLHFISCTGDTTHDLLNFTKPNNQINAIKEGTSFATLSIGGNDVLFGPIVQSCIYGAPKSGDCDKNKADGLAALYGRDFFDRYNTVLDKILPEKLKFSDGAHYTALYQTSYVQFFDDWTDECDKQKFHWWPKAKKMKKAVREEFNHMVHQLNEVLQYWMDIRNTDWTIVGYKAEGPAYFFTGVDWVDVDWKYQTHRFCRKGVKEPDRNDPQIWFFHAPLNPFLDDQQETNFTETDMNNFTWRPGRPGEPTVDVNDPKAMASQEDKVRTFHPKPDGFTAEKDVILARLIRLHWQEELAKRAFQIVAIGDITAIGDHCGYNSPTRYGFIPYLDAILSRPGNFGGANMRYRFNGRNNCGYSGDKGHEIYPEYKTIGDITATALFSHYLKTEKYPIGTVVPLMVGSKDIMNGRSLDDMKTELHSFLQGLWTQNPTAVVLIGTVPMHGDPDDKGHEFWPKQKKIIEWNAYVASIANYYSSTANRSIVKVHLTSPQQERIDLNVYIPSKRGYDRIAHDFFGGILQALERGFFQDPIFDIRAFEETVKTNEIYNLVQIKDEEIGKMNCHQPRGLDAPNKDDILKSLYRGADDKIDFIQSRACNSTFNCKFSWNAVQPDVDADYPFSNGSTCIMAGGDGPRHTTHHEVIVQKGPEDQELGDWCVLAVSALIDDCIMNENNYGGYWGDGKGRLVSISNTAWVSSSLVGLPLEAFHQEPSYNAKPNWDSEYIPFDEAMEIIKKE